MGFLGWLAQHGLDLLQTTSIVVGLFATVITIREDTRERKIGNLFALTNAHREIWSRLYERPELVRIDLHSVDLKKNPVTHEEELFVHTLVLHLRATFKARELGMQFNDDALTADIYHFFTCPIPRWVWERSKLFQDYDFVQFVDNCLQTRPTTEH
jgi:hypothetical protein